MPQTGFEAAQNLSLSLVDWICALGDNHYTTAPQNNIGFIIIDYIMSCK